MPINAGSFRDPSGQVFTWNGEIYRSIYEEGTNDYEVAKSAGVFDLLIEKGLLIPHTEMGSYQEFAPEGTIYCLHHPKIPMISYPWEWPFSMLKDAALLHLDLMKILTPKGFWLRDANPYNAQYDGEVLRLIDTLSIGKRVPNSPWVAYAQFCSSFLAPLALSAYADPRLYALFKEFINGYPLDLAVKLLPFKKRYQPGFFIHLTLHSLFQRSFDGGEEHGQNREFHAPKVSDQALTSLIDSLDRTVSKIKLKNSTSMWTDYANIRTYDDQDLMQKIAFVQRMLGLVKPEMTWDLGGNTGEFSKVAADAGSFVVSIDSDPACTEVLYQRIKKERLKRILPLTMNLSNPSPGLGWNNKERLSLSERGPAQLVFALALIHHLVFSSNIPMNQIAEWLNQITTYLVIEFIPIDDPMVKKLLLVRRDDHLPYSQEHFENCFATSFEELDRMTLANGRTLYAFKRR